MQIVTLNILTYISGLIGSTTFSQNDMNSIKKQFGFITSGYLQITSKKLLF